ncbi:MAG: GNAT family N-acetyltransferase [Rickettsiales bacterium]|nr:GNAT family N-acetyltransferase [Rickettsiales bacterium]
MKELQIIKADLEKINLASLIFNDYRIFYNQESNIKDCYDFLLDRTINDESLIYLGLIENNPVAFMQIYQSFSSVGLKKIYILNDLYVVEQYRGKKIGRAMLVKALEVAKSKNITKIALQTAKTNQTAQNLYQSFSFIQDQEFLTFAIDL